MNAHPFEGSNPGTLAYNACWLRRGKGYGVRPLVHCLGDFDVASAHPRRVSGCRHRLCRDKVPLVPLVRVAL